MTFIHSDLIHFMMNMVMIITVALLCLFFHVHGFQLCNKSGTGLVIIDGCLTNSTVKAAWLDCLDKVTGSRDQREAGKILCADLEKDGQMFDKVSFSTSLKLMLIGFDGISCMSVSKKSISDGMGSRTRWMLTVACVRTRSYW